MKRLTAKSTNRIFYCRTIFLATFLSLSLLITASYSKNTQKKVLAVWFDKSELALGKDSICNLLDKLATAHINQINVNCYFRGYVSYPDSKYLPQYPDFVGSDPIKLVIEEAHKRNMKVFAWIEYGFYAYWTPDATTSDTKGIVLDAHPDWASIGKDGSQYLHHTAWGDFYLLCPNNPNAQNFLIDLLIEMITKYDFDGVDLDRIRFASKNHCYCQTCQNEFEKLFNLKLSRINHKSKDYQKVIAFRKYTLTKFMDKLSFSLRRIKPNIIISSAVVHPDTIDEFGQDWVEWLKLGYLDACAPMLYQKKIDAPVNKIISLTENKYPIYFGIACDSNSPEVVKEQIELLYQLEKENKLDFRGLTFWYAGAIKDDLPVISSLFSN